MLHIILVIFVISIVFASFVCHAEEESIADGIGTSFGDWYWYQEPEDFAVFAKTCFVIHVDGETEILTSVNCDNIAADPEGDHPYWWYRNAIKKVTIQENTWQVFLEDTKPGTEEPVFKSEEEYWNSKMELYSIWYKPDDFFDDFDSEDLLFYPPASAVRQRLLKPPPMETVLGASVSLRVRTCSEAPSNAKGKEVVYVVVSFDITTLHGEAEGISLPNPQATYRFLTARLNEGKRCSLVVLVPADCSADELVTHLNNAWDILKRSASETSGVSLRSPVCG